jgi:hypothetical protein
MTNTPITDQRVEEIELMDLTPEQEKAELIILARNLESERNGFENEYLSRAEWIKEMNKILGYDNSDGFHSEPSPHQMATNLVLENKQLRIQLQMHQHDPVKS